MKAYRIKVTISDPINKMVFTDQRVFLFMPFKCAYGYEDAFINHCKVLFMADHDTTEDAMKVDYIYRTYEFHPFRDLFSRIWCLLKYRM